MKLFLKISGLGFLVQIVFVGLIFVTGIGSSILFFVYALPVMLLAPIFNILSFGPPDSLLGNILFICIQAAVYSPIFGGLVYLIFLFIKEAKLQKTRENRE